MTREELRALKRWDYDTFMEEWSAERKHHPGGFVPARLMGLTGIILRELEEDGKIECDGYGYRPA